MPHSLLAIVLVVVSLTTVGAPAFGAGPMAGHSGRETIASRTIHVHDGDTFYVRAQAFRLRGIDTPELGQPRSYEAKHRLIDLLRAGPVTIVRHGEDRYGRILADVFVDGRDVADVLRAEGFAKARPTSGRLRSREDLCRWSARPERRDPARQALGGASLLSRSVGRHRRALP
jgi:endonuclease YncB( thermonuclease family)